MGGHLVSQRPLIFQRLCLGNVALLAVIGIGAVKASSNIDQVFVQPSQIKEHYLLERLSDFDHERHYRIVVIEPPEGWPSRENLGIYSARTDLAQPWVLGPNIRLLLAERDGPDGYPPITIVKAPTEPKPGDYELDLRPLRALF